MKKIFTIALILVSVTLFSQTKQNTGFSKFDLRTGTGISFLSSGDYMCINFENELNYKISNYFTTSATLDVGKNFTGDHSSAMFIEGSLNLFISPCKNNGLNDFRVGSGISVFNISDTYLSSSYYYMGHYYNDYIFRNETAFGGALVIVEDTFRLNNRFSLGIKAFLKAFFNGDMHHGAVLKFGVDL